MPRWKLSAIVAGLALLTAGLGTGTWALLRPPDGPLPPPTGPWPTTGTMSVYLCHPSGTMKACKDGGPVTPAERRTIDRTLRSMPGVSGVNFLSHSDQYERLKEENEKMSRWVTLDDMPESFDARLSKADEVSTDALTSLRGVADVFVQRSSFWTGKADLGIGLCPEARGLLRSCDDRGATTAQERTAIHDALRAIDGVGAIYLEGIDHATKDARWQLMRDDLVKPGETAEFFHLVLDDPAVADQVKRVVKALPGFSHLVDHRPWTPVT